MRTYAFAVAAGLLAALVLGCGDRSSDKDPHVATQVGKTADLPSKGSHLRAKDRMPPAAGEAWKDRSAVPDSGALPARKPAMEEAHAGVEKRVRPRPLDVPDGVLTAGSFDDNLFPQFFRKFVSKSGQNSYVSDLPGRLAGQRLEVFVKNGGGAPVGNARVRVAAPAGGSSVELITRSDGRAVFLSSWDRVSTEGGLEVTVSGAGSTEPVKQVVERGANQCRVVLPTAPAPLPTNLDLAVVLDTTASMGDELEYLKAEIKSIAAAVHDRFPQVKQRYGLVVYRDEGMGDEYVTRKFDFTGDVNEFQRNLAAQSAAGGGDLPEAMHRGLEQATRLSWRDGNTARVVFLIADAPPHAPDGPATLEHVNTLRKRGVSFYPVAASCPDPVATEATEFFMRTAALLTGGQYLFLTDDSGVGDAHGEPHIPFYHVEKLNKLMVRMIAGELSGRRTDPDPKDVVRTVGKPPKPDRQD